jgi:hypothetical protein
VKTIRSQKLFAIAVLAAVAFTTTIARAAGPLPSWNDGKAKQSIIEFVEKVTKPGSPDFVPVPNASPCSTTTARSGANSRCPCNCTSCWTA